jgi:rhomboid protease GluP
MQEMDTDSEVASDVNEDATPLPIEVGEMELPRTEATAEAVLAYIAKATGQSWFPSQHAVNTRTDRDALDEPLMLLRMAGLIRIATWVRGFGQGYVLTEEGERALATGKGIPTNEKPPESIATIPPLLEESTELGEERTVPQLEEQAPSLPIDPQPPVIVPALLIANALWFFVGLVAAIRVGDSWWKYILSGNPAIAHRFGSVAGVDLLHGEWWRLLTSCFVHGNLIHLVVNLIALAMIGPLAEYIWGRWRLAIIYLISGLAGGSLAMALQPQAIVVGASGAIWGMLMSLVAYLPADVAMDTKRRLLTVIVVNVGISFLPGISWQAHLGGAVAGFVTAGLLNAMRFSDPSYRRFALGLLFALPVLIVGGLIVVMGRGESWTALKGRLAQEQMLRTSEEAIKTFDQEVIPLLNQLSPESVKPVQIAAGHLIGASSKRETPVVVEIQTKLTELKGRADKVIELLSPPVGIESVDRLRAKAKEYAEARSQSFGILLDLLTGRTSVSDKAWTDLGNAIRRAAALWQQLHQNP